LSCKIWLTENTAKNKEFAVGWTAEPQKVEVLRLPLGTLEEQSRNLVSRSLKEIPRLIQHERTKKEISTSLQRQKIYV
jgi:hypothetical protein